MLKIAMVGAGKVGAILTEAFYLNSGAKVTRIVSRTKESAEKLALKFDIKNYGADFNDIINDSILWPWQRLRRGSMCCVKSP